MNPKLHLSILLTGLLAACGNDPAPGGGTATTGGTASTDNGSKPAPASNATEDEAWHGELHGEAHELGSLQVAGFEMKVTQLGHVEAGHEAAFDVEFTKAVPLAVRAWIGIESAKGSRKAKLEMEDGKMHAHVEAPAELPDNCQLWLEIDLDSGPERGAIDIDTEH